MENNINKENKPLDFEKILQNVRKQLTPEYLEQCKQNAYKEDREYPENFSNWYSHIKDFGNFKSAEIISNQIFTLEEADLFKTEITEYLDFNKLYIGYNTIIKIAVE